LKFNIRSYGLALAPVSCAVAHSSLTTHNSQVHNAGHGCGVCLLLSIVQTACLDVHNISANAVTSCACTTHCSKPPALCSPPAPGWSNGCLYCTSISTPLVPCSLRPFASIMLVTYAGCGCRCLKMQNAHKQHDSARYYYMHVCMYYMPHIFVLYCACKCLVLIIPVTQNRDRPPRYVTHVPIATPIASALKKYYIELL
jgi:hypothetical protein